MRVLLVSFTYAPFFEMGGPPVKVQALARGLVGMGHQVTVLTADHGLPTDFDPPSDGVESLYLPIVVRYRAVPVTRGVRSFVRERLAEYDVVQIFGLYDSTGPLIARACRRLDIPYVVEPMGMFQPIIRSRLKKRAFHAVLGGPLLRGAANLVATSDLEREELLAGGFPRAAIVVRRNGVDLSRFTPLPHGGSLRRSLHIVDGPVLLFLGRLTAKKRPELLLSAFASSGAPGVLVFAGPDEDGGVTEKLVRQAEGLGIGERVRFAGPIHPEEIGETLVDADVFALPSENENFGNIVAEAMACQVPVIISDRCGIAPIVEQAGAGIVAPLTENDFSQGLASLLGDPELRARMGSAGGRAARELLSWDGPLKEEAALLANVCRP